jgi:methionyl-tRNA formyltransferase
MSKKILFFGNERLATGVGTTAPALRGLIAASYEVAAVVVAQNDMGRSRKTRPLEVAAVAAEHGIPLLSPADLAEARGELAAYEAQAAVLIAYGKIVPAEVLAIFPSGLVNIHPSLLPLHRGSTPLEAVMLAGASETGVSLMRLSEKMDAGPVYARETVALTGAETKQALADKLSAIGSDMLLRQLPGILDGSSAPIPQIEADATYDAHINKADGNIDWLKPAVQLEREIRAYAGWPRSRATFGTTDVIITAARVAEGSSGGKPGSLVIEDRQLGVQCGKGLLVIDSLIPSGKREMPAAAFLAGYKSL